MTIWLYFLMVGVGIFMIYAVDSNYNEAAGTSNFFQTSAGKQTIWIGISLLVMLLIYVIDWRFWRTFAYPIYVFGLLLLIAVLFFGSTIKGATSWFFFGSFSFQPSEFAKFGTCLAVSAYLSTYSTNIKETRSLLTAIGLFMFPMLLIMAQPDAGSALVFFSFFVVLYREGLTPVVFIIGAAFLLLVMAALYFDGIQAVFALLLSTGSLILLDKFKERRWFLGGIGVLLITLFLVFKGGYNSGIVALILNSIVFAVLATLHLFRFKRKRQMVFSVASVLIIAGFIGYSTKYAFEKVLQPHQQARINVWLRPDKSDDASLYNLVQSKMAIGSGGITGKGWLQGNMTKLNYVPEQSTDFIFCTIGEEQGFVGSFAIISFFLLLLTRLITIAERQRSSFSRHYAYGVAAIIFIHFFINIGMTMGLVPIIGIPLPFISKGGSSLLGFSLMLAVLLKLDSHRYSL